MKAVFQTDVGKIRSHNEDNGGVFINQAGNYLAVVADGMGGHLAGDVASEMTMTQLKQFWEETGEMTSPQQAEMWLKEHVMKVNESLFHHSQTNEHCQGMGTTVVAAICTNQFATIGHIGDSRCYLLNANGFQQMTEDHSLVNELVKSGQLSKEDAEYHPRKHVLLRALGTEQTIQLDVKTVTIDEGDMLLLCSDGLSNKVTEQTMIDVLTSDRSLEEKAQALINVANEHGGEDNITLAIVQFVDVDESR
ncbi:MULTISPECIES: Stp1/IreP family PP2C-type Ser/Thr phosphatase [Anoxybacillus]|uniref:protein-serine/threonine phosphatase n=2 Tax=Anoxybacillus TaxID=150247 RepID=R4FF43_9BACL|nr:MULTISPECIES: Stp1/IreP family PP2C-type Ser/Thr phosphatase [Anoxybacillus]NNU89365.1 Stp1/IreP family PP2C-type Ser/Thr phosphatase [Anoxybacillus sp. CHMUD]OOE01753.1 protein phosphatase [Anoxybacillus kestanbolensis]GAC92096.1 serine/threonine protein phosphatase PP2C family [Anoxybacillus flavithermus NBRC 109594]